jgi:hypothetical protein
MHRLFAPVGPPERSLYSDVIHGMNLEPRFEKRPGGLGVAIEKFERPAP